MTPGEHAVVSVDQALRARREGWQVRDTILVLGPGAKVEVTLLVRRPPEGTVAQNIIKHGVGALDIDSCRVDGGVRQATAGRRTVKWGVGIGGSSYELGTGAEYTTEGRWPPNLVLVHHPECTCVGTRKVRKPGGDGDATRTRAYRDDAVVRFDKGQGKRRSHYVDGFEDAPAWSCVEGCAAALLDAQSGLLRARGNVSPTKRDRCGLFMWGSDTPGPVDPGDSGGASRFYPQFRVGQEKALWTSRLIGER